MNFRSSGLVGAMLMLLCAFAVAQTPVPQPPEGTASVPVVTFELEWQQADPQWYAVSMASTGGVFYKSQSHINENEIPGDPYVVEFTASEATRTRVFELAKSLNFFKGNFEFKGKVAKTGTKTLRYQGGNERTETSFNYSPNPNIMELSNTFQKISTTLEFGRRLAYHLRFDKLGIDAQLKRMEDLNKSGMLLEVQALEPLLKQIIADRSFMNVSRQRAQRLLGLPVSPSGSR